MKKIRFNAKSTPSVGEAAAKVKDGFKTIEIQLIHPKVSEDEYRETDRMINELGCDISVVHTPLLKEDSDEIALEHLLIERYFEMFEDTCKYAEYIADKESKRIKVVIHNTFSKDLWERTKLIEEKIGPSIKQVLDKYTDVDLVVENSTSRSETRFKTILGMDDVTFSVLELNKIIGNRARTLLDTCHNMMNYKMWEKVTGENLLDWDETFKMATNGINLGLIHLNNMWIDGIDKDHGVAFDKDHEGDLEKLRKIMDAYDKYADCEITIEVREDDYFASPVNLLKTLESLRILGYDKE